MPAAAQLVFIEGPPGAGKSTAAQRLAYDSERAGSAACWYYEEQADHPLAGYLPTDMPVQGFMAQACARWSGFAAHAAPGLHLVESQLFQGALASLLLQDAAADGIAAFVRELMRCVEAQAPRLIRLREDDLDAALRRIISYRWGEIEDSPYVRRFEASPYAKARNARGFTGYLAFLRECSAIADGISAASGWPVLELPGALAPSRRLEAMREFLGIPALPLPVTGLIGYAGRYQADGGGECTITCDQDGLMVRDHPRMWRSGNRLLPCAGDRFLAVSWPFDVVFARSGGGVSSMAIVSAHAAVLGAPWRRLP